MQCAARRVKFVDYGIIIWGGVEIFNEVAGVGSSVVLGENFPESVLGDGVENLVEVEVQVVDVGVEGEIGDHEEDVVGLFGGWVDHQIVCC